MTPCVSPQLARALAARLRDATAAGEQLATFAFTEGTQAPSPELREGEELAAAHDFLLRVLGGVSDPLNWRVLTAIVPHEDGEALDVICEQLELPRLAVTERVNALIQLGLIARDLEHDRVSASPAGEALFEVVCEIEADVARWLSRRRQV